MNHPDTVIGDQMGLAFPTTIEPLQRQGAEFLTRAFQKTGALPLDNRVKEIVGSTEFFGGGMGRKLCLTVTYEKSDDHLHRDLFVKFPRDFGDPLRTLFGPLMEPEVRFALLSRQAGFPIAVPKCYFADYHRETTSGILITEMIAYGRNGIEACHAKCMDYEMPDQLGHYRALTKCMAQLAAHHKAGRFGPGIDQQFPFDPDKIDTGSRIPYTMDQLHEKLNRLRSFAASNPKLLPDQIASEQFLARFAAEAPMVLEHELAIRAYLNADVDYISLGHWNMNVDNGWFWADSHGELQAGLLDWGAVGQMNVAQAFYGMTCAAEAGFLNAHRGDLIALFVEQYRDHGGPQIDVDKLTFMIKLSIAVLGIAWILDAPSLVEGCLPDLADVADRHDARLKGNFLARAQLQLLVIMLNEWQANDIGSAIRQFIRTPRIAKSK